MGVSTAEERGSRFYLRRPPLAASRSLIPEVLRYRVSDLGDDDRGFFLKAHAGSCPGLVKLAFYGDGEPTFALALTTRNAAKGKTELVVAHEVGGIWNTTTLETTPGDAPVVWSEKPGEYKDVYGEKKIRAAGPVIIFCKYEAWAILYAWTDHRIAKIWVMD